MNYEAVYRTTPATPGLLGLYKWEVVHCTEVVLNKGGFMEVGVFKREVMEMGVVKVGVVQNKLYKRGVV